MTWLDHPGPWTEAEFLALGETKERIELIDGELRVSPSPTKPHQGILFNLMTILSPAARSAGLTTFAGVDVRLAPDRILTPDFAIGKLGWEPGVSDAADVVLACEITSPSNAKYDRVTKRALYASAGIEWYLLAEPDKSGYMAVDLWLYRLDGGAYTEHAVAEHGQVLISSTPFPIRIPTDLLIRP